MPSRDNDSNAAGLACSPLRLGRSWEPSPARERSFEVSAWRRALYFFSAALVAAPLLRVVLDLELCSPAMATTDEEEALMRRKGRVIFG